MMTSFFNEVKFRNIRQSIYQALNVSMIVISAIMIWKGLIVVTRSKSPIVVVLTGSMEPAFHRGDILFLTNYPEDPVRVGEIVVFKVGDHDVPILHRVLKLHKNNNGTKFLTKGDHNTLDDRWLYPNGQLWLTEKDYVVGRGRGFLPYVGVITIYMNEYPKCKFAILGLLAMYTFMHPD